ncbi:uncharacterized protein BDR25DRAFT_346479 [Lindgomyces ingoldianus]|uniref:Uncharacterized protein n=1 Tax=Lindgomyces ingoldianus TaxID=673940 RepID=A0ACB6QD54_9PLEO|nr:uncharacterized protein BDR25DRAFT_346479 [Lindgomyces ingoldianus]KAF2464954.1 hypothetical protein BDR25DRAFT_346479 [Lindgomyces ingoldianus]
MNPWGNLERNCAFRDGNNEARAWMGTQKILWSCGCCGRAFGLFIRSFINAELKHVPRPTSSCSQNSRFFSSERGLRDEDHTPIAPQQKLDSSAPNRVRKYKQTIADHIEPPRAKFEASGSKPRLSWQIQKAALKEKLGGEPWSPRKKLSPDAMEGIRHLNATDPTRFTTPILAEHFKVSPEAVRRILKSKWRPADEEHEERLKRWEKRGERIWSNLVELGVKPPKRWREMGVGRTRNGEAPMWKSLKRNLVSVNDSVDVDEDIIPIVGTSPGSARRSQWQQASLSQRLM